VLACPQLAEADAAHGKGKRALATMPLHGSPATLSL